MKYAQDIIGNLADYGEINYQLNFGVIDYTIMINNQSRCTTIESFDDRLVDCFGPRKFSFTHIRYSSTRYYRSTKLRVLAITQDDTQMFIIARRFRLAFFF